MIDVTKSGVNTTINGALLGGGLGGSYESSLPKQAKDKRAIMASKSDSNTLATWECYWLNLGKVQVPSACEKLPKEKVHVEIVVTQATQSLLDRLKKLGFVADKNAKGLVGMLPIAKLTDVTAMQEVTRVKFVDVTAKR